ncbi:MAG: flagellar basal-body MS-ring/collar protein FliF [Candidatus Eisenbacteria bacterium]
MSPLSSLSSAFGTMNASGSRRFLLLGAGLLAIVIVWSVGRWASTPTYVPLFRDLDLADVGTMEEKLRKAGISTRLDAGGTEILVPAEQAASARVALAKEGLPRGGRPGLELFDKPSWGMTDFTQRVTYQRALEGELARTIGSIRGVKAAQVHLVLPTASPLRKLERPASASVVLTLDGNAVLSPETVQGITYVVSNSVERLTSDNVAVMDDEGRVLSIPSGSGSVAGLTGWQLETERSVEQHMAEKVERLLETVTGPGKVRAQVAVEMNFDQIDSTIETFDPESQALTSEQRSETDPGAGGGSQVVVNNSYQTSRRIEKNLSASGRIERLTASVLVDETAIGPGAGAGAADVRVADLEGMVRDAIGIDPSRGDRLTVLSIPFGKIDLTGTDAGAPTPKPGFDPTRIAEKFVKPLLSLLAVAALLVLALRALRGGAAGSGSGSAAAAARARALGGGAGGDADESMSGGLLPGGVAGSIPALPAGRPAASGALTHVPAETSARVVKSWLAES